MTVLKKPPIANRSLPGFTLLEMTIVIAIIGLLIGSVIAAQSYVRNAKMTTSINEAKYLINAIHQFQDKYGALPGDLATAQNYWGVGSCPRANGAGVDSGVCNGDGNTYINSVNYAEMYYVFEHLARAGLIDGTYTGAAGPLGPNDWLPGRNQMASSFEPGAYMVYDFSDAWGYFGGGAYFAGNYKLQVQLGGDNTSAGESAMALFTSRDAYQLDLKFDDGKPGTGWMRSLTNGYCSDGSDPLTSNYRSDATRDGCVFAMNAM